jgi:hypothetical protein
MRPNRGLFSRALPALFVVAPARGCGSVFLDGAPRGDAGTNHFSRFTPTTL